MDRDRFDALARALAAPSSRRAAIRALGGAAVGGVLAPAGVGRVAAHHRPEHCCGCTPLTCKTANGRCGTIPDGCGGKIVCGCPEERVCGSDGWCTDPACCSPGVICGRHTTVGSHCCVAPQEAECCMDVAEPPSAGFARCCTPGVDCVESCPGGGARSGITVC
jgi:hypothetical protein